MRDALHTTVFVVLLALPGLGLGLGWNDASLLAENRIPADRPDWPRDATSLRTFPERFEAWFGDHFGLRTQLIRAAKRAEPVARGERIGVTAGRDGWLFYGNASELGRYRCVPLAESQGPRWARLARDRQRWFEQRAISFVWVMAPNKHTVHSEYLAEPVAEECDLEQVGRALGGEGLDFLDLRPVLRAQMRTQRLYHRTDTHWNQLGAFYGARAILERVAHHHPGVRPPALDAFEIGVHRGTRGGNLANFFLAYGQTYTEDRITLRARRAPRARPEEGSPRLDPEKHSWKQKRIVVETGDPALPSAVMFHDSFGYTLMPLLAEHFRRIDFVHSTGSLDPAVIEAASPDVVILLTAEARFLEGLPPGPDLAGS